MILAPQPGIKLAPPALEGEVVTTGPGKSLSPPLLAEVWDYDQKDKAVLEPLAASQKSTCHGGGWC